MYMYFVSCRHECACCKAKTNVDELVSDHGFDALISKFSNTEVVGNACSVVCMPFLLLMKHSFPD